MSGSSSVAEGSGPPGLHLGRVADFLAAQRPGMVRGPLSAELVTGGKSNLTFVVTDGAHEWVLRRPPLGHVLATAHDMAREYRVIDALGPTAVPVPATYALCRDPDVTGAPFYVMERARGTPYRRAEQLRSLGAERTRVIAERMVDTLVALHAVDPAAVGLSDFGRPEGFVERQVRRWSRQLEASRSRELPGAQQLHAALAERVPQGSDATVVHGDFRLDNLLVDGADRVTAVLDWEMATVGDPLTDVALLVVYQGVGSLGPSEAVSDVASAPGYPSAGELMRRYGAHSGRDLSQMGFHLGLAYYKLAVILEGIYYRYTHGQTVGAGFEHVGDVVPSLIAAGLDALDRP